MRAKDRGFFRSDLSSDFLRQGVQIGQRLGPRVVEAGQFAQDFALFQTL